MSELSRLMKGYFRTLSRKGTAFWASEATPLFSRPYLLCEGAVPHYFEV
jgi:hypothetical protein